MPLMVEPSSGVPIYGQKPSYTLITSTIAPASHKTLVQAAGLAPTAISVASLAKDSNVNQNLADQAAQQTGMDNTTPRNLMIGYAALLVICILISHPRFLARLFASLPSHERSTFRRKPSSYPFDGSGTAVLRPEKVDRVVGGGDLSEGWVFRTGEERKQVSLPYEEKYDPFASEFDDDYSLHTPSTPSPHFYPPPHITPLLFHLPLSSTLLLAPFSRLPNPFKSSVTLVQLYIVVAYVTSVAVALSWKSDLAPTMSGKGYGDDFSRSGLVALTQIPLVVALGVRGNLIGLCVGKGYERLKLFHKIVGRVLFLAASLHASFWIHKWAMAGVFFQFSTKRFVMNGFIAWGSIILIAITSLPWIRKTWYGVFEVCHFLGMIGMLVGMCFHVDVALPYCIAALFIYALSILSSFTKTRLAQAQLVALPGASTTVVTITALRSGWRAGQHVRIRVPALGFPLGAESHPFTIASAPDGEGMVLMCKAAGGWTERLYDLAAAGDGTFRVRGTERRTTATVILEGPYGGLGNTMLSSFSSVVLIAGGSGITHAMTLAHDLVNSSPTGVVRSRTVDLIWIIRTENIASPLMPSLLDLVNDAKAWETQCIEVRRRGGDRPQPTALRVTIYITRTPASSPLRLLTATNPFETDRDDVLQDRQRPLGLYRQPSEADQEKHAYLVRNASTSTASSSRSLFADRNVSLSTISVQPRRPRFRGILSDVADETIARHRRDSTNPSGICVTSCGPSRMCDDVRQAVKDLEGWKKRAVAGMELEEEIFGF